MSVEQGKSGAGKAFTDFPGLLQKEADLHRYDDIIRLPHHVSAVHPQMDRAARAAQFSPFAALSGYEDAIEETGRLTERRIELSEDEKALLDEKLKQLQQRIAEHPRARITYFVPDVQKEGGSWVSVTGVVKRIDAVGHIILLQDGTAIPAGDIVEMEVTEL